MHFSSSTIDKIIKIEAGASINLDHIDPNLLHQFFNFYQICSNVTDEKLRSFLLQSQRSTFTLLDQDKVDSVIKNNGYTYASEIQNTISDSDIRALVCFDLNANMSKYASINETEIIESLDETSLMTILETSLKPMMLSIVKHLLTIKEKE